MIESIWFMNNVMLRKIVWDEEYVAAFFSFWMESKHYHTFLDYMTLVQYEGLLSFAWEVIIDAWVVIIDQSGQCPLNILYNDFSRYVSV